MNPAKKLGPGIAACLALASCSSAPSDGPPICATPADRDAPADTTITVVQRPISAAEGERPFYAWTYDGDVPGPVLRMRRGESRRIKLLNESPRTASLHFMGMDYDIADDGTLESPQSVVEPGCAHVYTITANQPGIWPFLNHVEPRVSLARGQYGAIVVPADDEIAAAHEFVVFAGQLGIESEEEGDGDEAASGVAFHMTFNGRAYPRTQVVELQGNRYEARPDAEPSARVGDLVRWRLVNVSPDDAHSFGIHGHTFCDRGGIEDPVTGCPRAGVVTDIVDLSPLTSATFELVEGKPGRWMYHCHILDHVTDGMIGYYDVTP
jgi:FtsP/CotA-like multicopper oxidase with cupredoxin domain